MLRRKAAQEKRGGQYGRDSNELRLVEERGHGRRQGQQTPTEQTTDEHVTQKSALTCCCKILPA